MEKIEIVFQFINNMIWGLVIQGIIFVVLGVLIFIYPDLLAILVAIALVISGIVSFGLAIKISKYRKLQIKV